MWRTQNTARLRWRYWPRMRQIEQQRERRRERNIWNGSLRRDFRDLSTLLSESDSSGGDNRRNHPGRRNFRGLSSAADCSDESDGEMKRTWDRSRGIRVRERKYREIGVGRRERGRENERGRRRGNTYDNSRCRKILRAWNLHFIRDEKEIPDEFLEQLDDCRKYSGLSDKKGLSALLCCLTKALGAKTT